MKATIKRLQIVLMTVIVSISTGGVLLHSAAIRAEEKLPKGVMQEIEQVKDRIPPVVIDEVEVPYDVLLYAQLAYQGHAVTHAEKFIVNGSVFYRLRVDRDSDDSDYDSPYLTYTSDWKFLRETKVAPPQKAVQKSNEGVKPPETGETPQPVETSEPQEIPETEEVPDEDEPVETSNPNTYPDPTPVPNNN